MPNFEQLYRNVHEDQEFKNALHMSPELKASWSDDPYARDRIVYAYQSLRLNLNAQFFASTIVLVNVLVQLMVHPQAAPGVLADLRKCWGTNSPDYQKWGLSE